MVTRHSLRFLAVALLACAASTPALASDEMQEAHGGRMLAIRGGQLEVVHDGAENTLTIYATRPDGNVLVMKRAPELVLTASNQALKAAPRDVAFEPVAGAPGAWRSTCPSEAGWLAPSMAVRVTVNGRSELVALSPTPRAHHGVLIFGADALRLKVTSDEPKGLLTFQPLTAADAKVLGNALPRVIVDRDGRHVELATKRGGDARDTYVLSDTGFLRNAQDVVVRVKVAERDENAALVLAPDKTRGIHGGAMVAIESPVDGAADHHFEVIHDAATGTLTVCQTHADGTPVPGAPPTVVLNTPAGSKQLDAVAARDLEGCWTIHAPELRSQQVDGTLRVRFDEESREVVIPAMPPVRATPAIG